ncbi:MAG TPA: hypothetical protein VNA21_03600, partial [Steroidobacteraceae bacterium]|nr:hypothetical protein [Steroidobacteraceae bacterium]
MLMKARATRRQRGQDGPSATIPRQFLRSVVARNSALSVGEPIRLLAKLRRDAPENVEIRIGGAIGSQRYVSFAKPGRHRVPVVVRHPDGRTDRTDIEFDVTPSLDVHVYPILEVRQEPTNPMLLLVSLKNYAEIYRDGVKFEWQISGYGAFAISRPFFVIDCDRLLNPTDQVIPFDLAFTVIYPNRVRRTARESFRVWNDYAFFKTRGILKPRLVYDFRARGVRKDLAASCMVVNDDDEFIEISGRQIEILYNDADRIIVPGPVEPMQVVIEPRSRREINCSIPRLRLPDDALGYAVHFHGKTRSGLKVEASAYFEYYHYKTKYWSDVSSLAATDLLREVKAALTESAQCGRLPTPIVKAATSPGQIPGALSVTGSPSLATTMDFPNPQAVAVGQLSLATVRSYVETMKPAWGEAEFEKKLDALETIVGGHKLFGGD